MPPISSCPNGGFCTTLPPTSQLAASIPGLEFLDIGTGSLGDLVASLYIWGIGIVGLAAFIGIIIGGVYYLTAAGSTSMTSQGKKWISNSLFGLGLALISYLLLNTINPALVNPNQARIPLITGELNTRTGGPSRGTIPEGGACTANDCAAGSCYKDREKCIQAFGGETGICRATCTPPPKKALGEPCENQDECVSGICREFFNPPSTSCRVPAQGVTGQCTNPNCKLQ